MGETADEVRAARAEAAGTRGDDPEQIRSEIEETRAEMSQTINALEEKLDPARIADRVKDEVRERASEAIDSAKEKVREATGKAQEVITSASGTVSDFTQRAGTAVKEKSSCVAQYISKNPAPFVLVGLNLGLLVWDACRNGESRTKRGQESSAGMADGVREAAATLTDTVRDVSDRARKSSRAASCQVKTAIRTNPITFGMAALAAGTIVGIAIPIAEFDKEHFGDATNRFVHRAKLVSRELRHATVKAGRALKRLAQDRGVRTEELPRGSYEDEALRARCFTG
jgi:ElaB/YqjD/DUF883 family membrane-anchored ribosome-binding protein